jgi:hypothetical protein
MYTTIFVFGESKKEQPLVIILLFNYLCKNKITPIAGQPGLSKKIVWFA